MNTIFTIPVLALLATGCATVPQAQPVSSDHPASADAQAAPMPQASKTFDQSDPILNPAAGASTEDNMKGMNMNGMKGMDIKEMDMGQMKGMNMKPSSDQSKPTTEPASAAYVCPMHPEVTSDKPGTCPKCGMTLVKNAKASMTGGAHGGN